MPNPFLSNSVSHVPVDAGSAGAYDQPPVAPAGTISDGQDVPARMQGSKARHSGLARDDERPGDTMQESRPAHPATAPSETIPASTISVDNFTSDIPEVFRAAVNYLCRHESRFVPDKAAMWDAMFDESAPRLRADDPVWADEAPLFIRLANAR